jgi:hypothetical protein
MSEKDLPDAEYYLFYDSRTDGPEGMQLQLQYHSHLHEKENARIQNEQAKLLETLDPHQISEFRPNSLFARIRFPMPAELVHTDSWFASRLPARLEHFETVQAPPSPHTDQNWYDIVSPEWKAGIESLEPNVHEFFPHTLNFMVGSVTDRWVFRPRIEIEGALLPSGAYVVVIPDDEDFGQMKTHFWQHTKRTGLIDVYLDVAKLCGKHWARCEGDFPYNLVSKPLAEKLLPLLPWASYLLPLKILN